MSAKAFSIDHFESLIAKRCHEPAAEEMLRLFDELSAHQGQLLQTPLDEAGIARIAAAIAALFTDPGFQFGRDAYLRFCSHQRWMGAIFGASVFRTSDHVIRALSHPVAGPGDRFEIAERDLHKFCLLYSLDSAIPLEPEALWQKDKALAATLFLSLLSSRLVMTQAAHEKRERLLEWLPPRLAEIPLETIPSGYLHDAYMQCSYACTAHRHEIKRAINTMIRRWLRSCGVADAGGEKRPGAGKPTLVVVLDVFHRTYAGYRTFSALVQSLRSRFRMIALALYSELDAETRTWFDEVLEPKIAPNSLLKDNLARIVAEVEARAPDVVFHIGVGILHLGLFLANIRMAPIQVVSHGHPASTFSEVIDYFCLEEEYADLAPLFGERLLPVPADAFVAAIPPGVENVRGRKRDGGRVETVVVLTAMKLNPVFLRACRRIMEEAGVPMRIHVLVGGSRGILTPYVERSVSALLPDAVIYPQLDRPAYLEAIAACEMYLEPFPFGNGNTTIDCLALGVPGVSLRGPEIFGRMGSFTLKRLGVDARLITETVEQYVETAIAFARSPEWRNRVRSYLKDTFAPERISSVGMFNGSPERFAEALSSLLDRGLRHHS